MPAQPSEGGAAETRSLMDLDLTGFNIEVTEWTDGQLNVSLTLLTQAARYKVPMAVSQFLALTIECETTVIDLLRKGKVGK